MSKPLDGIRILDWTIWQQGPYSTAMLADYGAEVIKIEEAKNGDPGRGITAVGGTGVGAGRNFYFESNNRHKKSVALNLKTPQAHQFRVPAGAAQRCLCAKFSQGSSGQAGT